MDNITQDLAGPSQGPTNDLSPARTSVLPQEGPDAPQSMSKNALKKAAKAQRLAAVKLERRAREREAKKEKKRARAEKRGEDGEEEEEKKRRAKRLKLEFGGTVVVDLGFDDMMNDKEIVSLCSQLAYTYSVNRQASFPFSLIFSSLNGRTYDRLEGMGGAAYKRWSNTQWWSESYEHLWANGPLASGSDKQESLSASNDSGAMGEPTSDSNLDKGTSHLLGNIQPRDRTTVVYLTADTEDELTELKPEETYIIGGICDHNRYKNLCLNKARESGVRTARLPIGRYLTSLPTRKVLTVNQVFEILVKWVETKDWEESLYSVIPRRKFHQGAKGDQDANIDGTAEEGDADDERNDQVRQGDN